MLGGGFVSPTDRPTDTHSNGAGRLRCNAEDAHRLRQLNTLFSPCVRPSFTRSAGAILHRVAATNGKARRRKNDGNETGSRPPPGHLIEREKEEKECGKEMTIKAVA